MQVSVQDSVQGDSAHGDDRRSARSSLQRLRLSRPHTWAATTAVLLVCALAVLVGRALPAAPGGVLERLLREQDSLLLALSATLFVLTMWAFRRFRFAQLARRPGPVEILPFATGTEAGVPVENIAAHFQKTLRDVSLAPPMSMPGEPVSQDFLQVVRSATSQATNPLGAVAGLLSAVQVTSAYRVSGVLRTRERGPSLGLTVHVAMLPQNTGAVRTFWADDWIEVAELGAHFVGSYVLPRSRICARPPWTAWQDVPVPPELFHDYQTAQQLLRGRRYEEALDALFSALRRDPQNPYIRIQVAQLREQLGQHLDAVADYVDIVEIQAWQDRRLWRRLRRADPATNPAGVRRMRRESERPFFDMGALRNGPEALLVARYRLVSALVRGTRLAGQWREADLSDNERRSDERTMLRERLQRWLAPRYREFRTLCTGTDDCFPEDFDEFAAGPPELLGLLFQFVALRETLDLIRDYAWSQGRRRPSMPISQGALRVLGVWTALHFMLAERTAARCAPEAVVRCDDRHLAWAREKLHLGTEHGRWPPRADMVEFLLAGALRWKPRTLRGWQEHYNSASVFAVVLLDRLAGPGDAVNAADAADAAESPESPHVQQLAIKAVRCLEQAVLTTGSGLASQYHQWLTFGDQDLNALRQTEWFIDFVDRYFPRSEMRKVTPPREILQEVLRLHVTGLVRRYAAMRAAFWHSRARLASDPLITEELAREPEIALMVGRYLRDYWSWQVRLQLIAEGRRFAARLGDTTLFDARFPSGDAVLDHLAEGGRRYPAVPSAVSTNAESPNNVAPDPDEAVRIAPQHRHVIEKAATLEAGARRPGRELRRLGQLWGSVETLLHQVLLVPSAAEDAVLKLESDLNRIAAEAKRADRRQPGTEPGPAPARTVPEP